MSEQSKDGWIEWNGGECPVDPETVVQVWLREDTEDEANQPGSSGPAGDWLWFHEGGMGDIIAYRSRSTPPAIGG